MNIFTDILFPIIRDTAKSLLPILPYTIFFIFAAVTAFLIFNHFYKKGSYYKVTHNPYIAVRLDLGKYGEYLTYKELRSYENTGGRFLFNLYIPKEDGETSEIDVILISQKGIFVFESKNYSGWIFGSEHQPKWTQTLPRGRGKSQKEHFYNPIMQNKSHIKHLRALVGDDIPLHPVTVFSNRCVLKNVEVNDPNVCVINRYNAAATVADMCFKTKTELSSEQIDNLYSLIYPFSQTDNAVKAEHIAKIKKKTEPSKPKSEQITAEPALTCPRCGSKLVLRTAKRGDRAGKQFYGCSKYPQCKYTRDV